MAIPTLADMTIASKEAAQNTVKWSDTIVWGTEFPQRVTDLTKHLNLYLERHWNIYRDRFEQDPPDAVLRVMVQRFMDQNYPPEAEDEH